MSSLGQDFRFAFRVLRKSPGFTLVAALMLGVGIAANATVFGWIDTLLLRPLPGVANAHELASLEAVGPEGQRLAQFPHPDFRDFERQMTQGSGSVAMHFAFFTVGPPDSAQRFLGQVVSANYFSVLGVRPFLGRMFSPEEDQDVKGAYPYAVVSHRLWRTYFREDPRLMGRAVRINGHMYTVVGVAPADFAGTMPGAAFDVWVPLSRIIETGTLNTWAASDRNARFLDVLVRLKPGVTIEQAQQEAQAVAARMAAAYPDTHRGIGAKLVPIWKSASGLQSALRSPLHFLMGVCILVLLIACANVANLLMARTVSRHREFGVRIALGAGARQLVRQLLAELSILAGAGALAGLLLSQWMAESLFYVLPALDSPVRNAIDPILHPQTNGAVLAFTALLAIAVALVSTIAPALYAARLDVNETLKESGRGSGSGARSHRLRGALVVAEVALAAVAVIGAGLAVNGFRKFSQINLGFEPRNVLVAHLHLSTNGYSLPREKQFVRDLRLRVEGAPGVEQVSYADSVPLSVYGQPNQRVQDFGGDADQRGVVTLATTVVAPGYFDLMRIPLLAGRDFRETEDRRAPLVTIVNQAFAARYFPGQDPLGRRVRVSGSWTTIVGLVRDCKYGSPIEPRTPHVYLPFGQMFWSGNNNFFYVRAANLDAARAVFRKEAAALDPNRGLYELSTVEEYSEAGLFGQRVAASLLSALAVLALILAAAGLYSVMAYAVSQRTQEIGVRIALGAARGQVLRQVLRQGLAITSVGVALGAAAALVGVRLLAGVSASFPLEANPTVFAVSTLCLLATAVAASYIPARRAAAVDPMTALRSE
jgi:predicted permease